MHRDIVIVEAGERVPADKRPEALDAGASVGDRLGMLFMGTTVSTGYSRRIVMATGRPTEMGRIADLADSADTTKAPLEEGLAHLSRRLTIVVSRRPGDHNRRSTLRQRQQQQLRQRSSRAVPWHS